MNTRILVVEDEIFVAVEVEGIVTEMGYEPAGIAADRSSAMALAETADVALVDLNLRDGPTGIHIGRTLAEAYGVSVIFMTANPAQLGTGVPGAMGVLPKPASERDIREAVHFAVASRNHVDAAPPRGLKLFAEADAAGLSG